jgi:cohesin complex subunit SCC1
MIDSKQKKKNLHKTFNLKKKKILCFFIFSFIKNKEKLDKVHFLLQYILLVSLSLAKKKSVFRFYEKKILKIKNKIKMFFATYVLTQKGPLAKVWLAAHWDKKLTSKDVKVIDLKQTIVHVVQPSVPIALRTSGELMLGIVRIYALKVANLLKDATEATSVLLKPRAINIIKVPVGGEKGGKDGEQQYQNAIAITMDVTVGRIGADQLCDADFAEVADLLSSSNNNNTNNANKKKGAAAATDKDAAASWWFATDASQAVEEIQYNSRHDAEMARFRAELDKSSAAGSKKGSSSTGAGSSSNASVEQARAGGANNNKQNNNDLDLGFAPPANLEDENEFLMNMKDNNGMMNLDAVLDHAAGLPGLSDLTNQQQQNNNNTNQNINDENNNANNNNNNNKGRKLRMVIVLDAETSLKPEALKKMADNRSDIVHSDRRHGPLDESEVQDRAVLRDEAIVSDCSSLACYFNNDVLRAAFHAAVQAVATERISEIERLRGGAAANVNTAAGAGKKKNQQDNNNNNNQFDDDQQQQQIQNNNNNMNLPGFDDEFMMNLNNNNNSNELPSIAGQRRGRGAVDGENNKGADSFSASTLATLKNLRENLLAAGAKSTSLRAMVEGQTQQTACRTFVDLLHLASHQFVAVAQKEAFGSIVVTRGPKFATTATK